MKTLSLFFVLFTLVGVQVSFADSATPSVPQVTLDSSSVHVGAEKAVLVRTANTPDKIKVNMTIPYGERVCTRYDYREVWGPDPSCGWYSECHWQCRGYYNGHCTGYWQSCRDYMRSCYHLESVCVEYDIVTHTKTRSFTLKFKNASDLAPGEEERFEVTGYQPHVDSSGDRYSFKVLESKTPYQVKISNFFGDRIKVKGSK